MKGLLLSFVVMFFSVNAWAQEGVPPECRVMSEYKPPQGAAYQPGVDVNGKPVVSADLNSGSAMGTDQTIVVPLTIDFAKKLQNENVQGLNLEGTLGFFEIKPGGQITYNGQDLTSEVHVLCGKNYSNALKYPEVKEMDYDEEESHEPASPAASQETGDGHHPNAE